MEPDRKLEERPRETVLEGGKRGLAAGRGVSAFAPNAAGLSRTGEEFPAAL